MTDKKKPIKYNTIVFDTSTELELILRQSTFEGIRAASTKTREKLAPNEYTLRNLMMTSLFDRAKEAGINLVTLQYMKEKWTKVGENRFENTGELIMDGWQKTETEADVILELEEKAIAGKSTMVCTIVKVRFDRDFNRTTYRDTCYDDLSVLLLEEYYDENDFPNLAVSITGAAKSGKTHLSYTFPEPIKVYCFNGGADFVRRKFPSKHIDIVNYRLPIIDELDPKPWAKPIWDKFYADFKETVGG